MNFKRMTQTGSIAIAMLACTALLAAAQPAVPAAAPAPAVKAAESRPTAASFETFALFTNQNVYCSIEELIAGKPTFTNVSIRPSKWITGVTMAEITLTTKTESKRWLLNPENIIAIECTANDFTVCVETEDNQYRCRLESGVTDDEIESAREDGDLARLKYLNKMIVLQKKAEAMTNGVPRVDLYLSKGAAAPAAFKSVALTQIVPVFGSSFVSAIQSSDTSNDDKRFLVNTGNVRMVKGTGQAVEVKAPVRASEHAGAAALVDSKTVLAVKK